MISPLDVSSLGISHSGSPKWQPSEELSRVREALREHYGVLREGQLFADFLNCFNQTWYSARHSSWQEIADLFDKNWQKR